MIQGGEHVAFVGGTGSGKSTLAKLLCAFFQPNNGQIYISGRKLSDCSAEELARFIAYVSQDVTLFSGTILQNLTLWKDEISMEAVSRVIQDACLEELILAKGLYGEIEEGGRNLSGGEKQRIDIARALLQDTPILILDEATSALDVNTEAKLINNLRQLNKTIIFVAHRLSSIRHCHQIIVLKNGEIIERGNHEQLMARRQHYYLLQQNS